MQLTPVIASEQLTMNAQPFLPNVSWLTNSLIVTGIVTVLVLVWARLATRHIQVIPNRQQNTFEAVVEGLYRVFEGIVGRHMIPKVFPLLATLFLFILASNWFGLIPGVGTIGWGKPAPGLFALEEVNTPLLRPANADLNTTVGMALFFMGWWLIWTLFEVGLLGFLKDNFEPKGGIKGVLWYVLLPLFIFVGCIEMISIAFRPVSLSLRLYGNMYAGETLLHTMTQLGLSLPVPLNWLASIIFPLPFYFLELFVGLLQAFVFSLLCAVYIRLSTSHGGEETASAH
jgi:F-type H+-transporting ATPase subunit a